MKVKYGECPDCGQSKIYMSQAGRLVCGNKKCGRIFKPTSSELRLKMEQLIKTYEKALKPIFKQVKIK
jgi:ribosomal protein S27AE